MDKAVLVFEVHEFVLGSFGAPYYLVQCDVGPGCLHASAGGLELFFK